MNYLFRNVMSGSLGRRIGWGLIIKIIIITMPSMTIIRSQDRMGINNNDNNNNYAVNDDYNDTNDEFKERLEKKKYHQ
jgi:hypothetical protein